MLKAVLLISITFLIMEAISWFLHKYIMHGALWVIHKTHHQPHKNVFELNDLFSLFFAAIAIIFIIAGSAELDSKFWIGWGITLYGFSYFIFHDIIIHKRIKLLKKPGFKYFKAISKAHRDHHKSLNSKNSRSYGLFLVPKEYFREKIK
ncbi:sterol desaturase family protein [soil metagenome]